MTRSMFHSRSECGAMVLRRKYPPALNSPFAFMRMRVRSQIPSSSQSSGVLIQRPVYLPTGSLFDSSGFPRLSSLSEFAIWRVAVLSADRKPFPVRLHKVARDLRPAFFKINFVCVGLVRALASAAKPNAHLQCGLSGQSVALTHEKKFFRPSIRSLMAAGWPIGLIQ